MSFVKIFSFLFLSIFSLFFTVQTVLATDINTPLILNSFIVEESPKNRLVLEGLVPENFIVSVHIDQKYNGKAKMTPLNGVNSFFYTTLLDKTIKNPEITIISRDRLSLNSSNELLLTVNSLIVKNIPNSIEILAKNSSTNFLETPFTPLLVSPTLKDIISTPRPIIRGKSLNNLFLHFYIDGKLDGKIKTNTDSLNFSYKPFLNLSVGKHQVWVIAENKFGEKSQQSNILHFSIENKMPAPTILSLKQNDLDSSSLSLLGISKNDALVKIFIDHALVGSFPTNNSSPETSNFIYQFNSPLERGKHFIYTTATDNKGKESPWSNIKTFNSYTPMLSATKTPETMSISKNTTNTPFISTEKITTPLNFKKEETETPPNTTINIKQKIFIPLFLFLVISILLYFSITKPWRKKEK